ncbi:carbohydrate ABC transporter permease [Halegenticoccus tardaugens]|uniref:carbohydrate ABC transporter permease n=1 Tax=Halegenticoccus tardaugens TaxID=2071624 RepID=UPI00100BF98B|nr:carbohydrate ABC transporter permease [Halegenticoccus tardaugens]
MSSETDTARTEPRGATADERSLDLRRIGLYAALAAMVAFYLAPLETGLTTAFKTQDAFSGTTPFVPPPPSGFTVEPWVDAFSRLRVGLFNSLLFALPATILSAALGSIAAYGLTNVSWRGQVGVVVLFVAGIFVPYQSVLVPLTQFWTMVDLPGLLSAVPPLANRASLIELALTHTAYGIPICTILFRSYYATIDPEMLEAARLDGATVGRIYRKIILPLSVPIFAVTLIYQFTQIWNDLLFALVLVSEPSNQVVTLSLNELQGSLVQQYNLQMAGAFIAALPTLLVYVLFGEQFAKGVAGES